MNVTTETDDFPALASLVISPNLQALLEFDDRLRASSESQKRPEVAPAGRVKHGRYPSWSEQEVPTVSLPPPRRRKKSGIPTSPKTIFELESVAPSMNILPGIEEPRESEEVVFTRPEDILGEVEAQELMNPYLNPPPSPPRYFYPRPEDEDGVDQPSGYYTLEKSRSTGRRKRQRSHSDQSRGGQLVSPRPVVGGNAGSRQKERGEGFISMFLLFTCALTLLLLLCPLLGIGATCSSDETAPPAPPQGFSLFRSLSSSTYRPPSPC